jgi:hypothetical protein
MRTALTASVLSLITAAQLGVSDGAAARDNACGQIPRTEGREVEPFEAYLPTVDSALSLPKEGVFTLRLLHMSDVIYPKTPDQGGDGSFGGFVVIENIPAGRYSILLSDEVRLEALQDNERLPVLALARNSDCPGVRQAVEFQVMGQPLLLQVSDAPNRHINIAFRRIWDFQWRW